MSKGQPKVRGLIESGLRHHRAGHLREAKTVYEQVLALAPRNPDALHLLGVVALQTGDVDESIRLIRAAVAVQPKHQAFHSSLAKALMEARRPQEALSAFKSAERLDPGNPEHQMGVANCLALTGGLVEAESRLRRITRHFPDFALAWFNLANAVRDQGRTAEALDCFRRALKLDDNLIEAHNNLGGALLALGRLGEAEQAYRRSLALRPDDLMLQCNLASVLIDRGKFAEAEAVCRQALARGPRFATAHWFLGAAIGHQGRLREALESHRRVVELEPDNARALTALGVGLHEVGMSSEGVTMLERALSLAPNSAETHFQLAAVKLALGEFQEGWREHLHRPPREQFIRLHPGVALSSTLPRDLAGRHICVLPEQGLGDQLFFLRFAGNLKARGARVTYCATPKIASILQRVPAIDLVIPATEPAPPADDNLLTGDLPLATMVPSPSAALALMPLPEELAALRNRLAELGPAPYLGLTWRGGTPPEEQGMAAWSMFKQIPLRDLGGAVRGISATWLALQRNPQPGEIGQLSVHLGEPVHDLSALNEDLEAMLALLALIDDYVGVSNTNMHLRAGAGRTARVLVPCPAEWRWMAAGDESPWFPGFRIYRQGVDGGWDAALGQLRGDLLAAYGNR